MVTGRQFRRLIERYNGEEKAAKRSRRPGHG